VTVLAQPLSRDRLELNVVLLLIAVSAGACTGFARRTCPLNLGVRHAHHTVLHLVCLVFEGITRLADREFCLNYSSNDVIAGDQVE
jgi:hypothetical protein